MDTITAVDYELRAVLNTPPIQCTWYLICNTTHLLFTPVLCECVQRVSLDEYVCIFRVWEITFSPLQCNCARQPVMYVPGTYVVFVRTGSLVAWCSKGGYRMYDSRVRELVHVVTTRGSEEGKYMLLSLIHI